MRHRVTERIQFPVHGDQLFHTALQVPVEQRNFIFSPAELRDHLLQFDIFLLQQISMRLDQSALSGKLDEDSHFRAQNFRHDGFGQVIDRAHVISTEDVFFAASQRRQEDDGRGARALPLPDQRGGLESVHLRHHHIQENDREIIRQQMPESLSTGVRAHDLLSQ